MKIQMWLLMLSIQTICLQEYIFASEKSILQEVPEDIRRAVWTDDEATILTFYRTHGKPLSAWIMYGMPLIHKCAVEGAIKSVAALLDEHPGILYVSDPSTGDTILHVAVAYNMQTSKEKAAMIALLIDRDVYGTLRRAENRRKRTAYAIAVSDTMKRYEPSSWHNIFGGHEYEMKIADATPGIIPMVKPLS